MKNPDKSCTVFVMSSNYPRFSGDICGWFIHEISRQITLKGFCVTVLSPHADQLQTHQLMDGVAIRRFRYFFPPRFEKLVYGSGFLFNIRKHPFTFFTVPSFFVAEFLWACRILHRTRPRLLHTHWLVPQGLIGALLHYLTGLPHIATIHGSDLNVLKKNTFLHPVCRFITRNSSIITVNSRYMKQQLLEVAPGSERKVRVIPMGINPAQYRPASHTDMKQHHDAGHLILSVGRLIDWKGTGFLIAAMPAVLEKFPDTKLLIVGNGPERGALVRYAQGLDISDRIELLGTVTTTDLPSYYLSADVFVLPSITLKGKTEGLGVVLLEAMAAGCPVIGSNVGGIPDIISDGENGFLVPEQNPGALADRIIQIFSDAELRQKFRENAYERIAESFTWDKTGKRFSEVYSETLDQKEVSESGDIS
jgi:L-malate glycosyltransferase